MACLALNVKLLWHQGFGNWDKSVKEMSGVFISPPLFHLLSKPWCHQFQGTKFLTQALDRESQFGFFFFFLFARFAGNYPECVECLSLLGECPGLIHRTVNSGLAMPCSIQIRTHLCVPGHCWGWHMLVGRRGLALLSACDTLCSLLGGASGWGRDGSVWEEQREHGTRDGKQATTTEIKRCVTNRGDRRPHCQWKGSGGAPFWCLPPFFLLSFFLLFTNYSVYILSWLFRQITVKRN